MLIKISNIKNAYKYIKCAARPLPGMDSGDSIRVLIHFHRFTAIGVQGIKLFQAGIAKHHSSFFIQQCQTFPEPSDNIPSPGNILNKKEAPRQYKSCGIV